MIEAGQGSQDTAKMLVQNQDSHANKNAGRLASRAIKDWVSGCLADGFYEWRCSALRDPSRHFANSGSDHDLIVIPTQSYDLSSDPNGNFTVVSSMCRFCRYHFVFRITSGLCGNRSENPMHHFLCDRTEYIPNVRVDDPTTPDLKRYPMEAKVVYRCSVCPQKISVEVSLPRMKNDWLRLIGDEQRVREALKFAKTEEPERFQDSTPERDHRWITGAVSTLNSYLRNILEDDGMAPQKRILFRNKIFMVQFGPICEPIFRYLGFEVEYDQTRDENLWRTPRLPPPDGKSPLGSLRAFYEDVRSEVQSFLDENPPQNEPVVKPISSAWDMLEHALGCRNIHSGPSKPIQDSEVEDLRMLGATAEAEDSLLRYAYTRQVEADPLRQHIYLEALGRLAAGRDVDLQMFVFAEQEKQSKTQQQSGATRTGSGNTDIDKAYAHFGLSRSCPEDAQYFINVYKTYREQSPAQKSAHRAALLQIGKDRKSDRILSEVYNSQMEPPEAYAFLSADKAWPMDSIAASAQTVLEDLDLNLVILALDTISLDRSSDDPNRQAFETLVADIRSHRVLPDSVMTDAGPTNNQESVDMALPIGLGNLRNTCYLNSILQYFYSVKAVRDLVLDLDRPPLEPTEQHLQSLLTGTESSDLETGRAFVGHEFARELHTLFRELDTSTSSSVTPRQRLANAALLRPGKMRPKAEPVATVPGPTEAPPLPPRASETTEPKVTIDSLTEPSETSSTISSQTLVGQPDEDPSYVVVEREPAKVEDVSPPTAPLDVEMTDAQEAPQKASSEANEADPKQSKLSVEELAAELDKPNVGSDQMDVDEVMGNAIDHLRAAFKVARVGISDGSPDPIEEAFFSKFIDNRKKVGDATWNRSTRTDRWVTAYPGKVGTRDIYDALSNSFDLETLPGGLLSFTTIEKPASNFHICIQRSDGVRKNVNPINIPERLFLDRYMHYRDGDAASMKAKQTSWDITTRVNEINEDLASRAAHSHQETEPSNFVLVKPIKEDTTGQASLEDVDAFIQSENFDIQTKGQDEGWSILSPSIKDIFARHDMEIDLIDLPSTAPDTASPGSAQEEPCKVPGISQLELHDFWDKFSEREDFDKHELLVKQRELFENMTEVEYRLHAVVCHAGSTAAAGHYWVWIHDFEQDVWRKYNDTRVSVHPSDFVMKELQTKGEPYYLAYVRAKDIPELVNVPRRQLPPGQGGEPGSSDTNQTPPRRQSSTKDTPMTDIDEKPVAEHVEDVEMAEGARGL